MCILENFYLCGRFMSCVDVWPVCFLFPCVKMMMWDPEVQDIFLSTDTFLYNLLNLVANSFTITAVCLNLLLTTVNSYCRSVNIS